MEQSQEESKEQKPQKPSSSEYGIDCLNKIIGLKTQRIKLFDYNTAYDSYIDFLTEVKNEIPIENLRQAFPHKKEFATHEMILTPNFVCYLAMKQLRKLLEIDQLPDFEKISDQSIMPNTDQHGDSDTFSPDNKLPDSLHSYIKGVLTELNIQNQ